MSLRAFVSVLVYFSLTTSVWAAREIRTINDLPKAKRDAIQAEKESTKELPLDDFAGGVAGGIAALLGKGYFLKVVKKKP